jgi:N-acetylmuramoyl-L-alanine amidase
MDIYYEKGDQNNLLGGKVMTKIVIDAGHGLNTPGKRSPAGEREWTFNNRVALAAIKKLEEYENVEILRVDDSTGETDIPLQTRSNRANEWKADVYLSIHHNAYQGIWGRHSGVVLFTMDHPNANPKSVEIAKAIHPKIVQAMGLQDRGLKQANFHVLRETHMPAVLSEGGFMDSTIDIVKMRNEKHLQAQGHAIAEGLAEYFNLIRKKSFPEDNKPTYRILVEGKQIGAYREFKNMVTVLSNSVDKEVGKIEIVKI